MNNSEWVLIVVFIVGLFFLQQFLSKRYLNKLDPDKVEGMRLIMFAFFLGSFYSTALEGTHGIGFQVGLVILTAYFIYRSYKWMKGMNHKTQEG